MRSKVAALFAAFLTLTLFASNALADTSSQQAALQAQLQQINAQIAASQNQLSSLQNQRASYQRDVSILDSQIKQTQLEIKARNLNIQQLQNQIATTKAGIAGLDASVAAGEQSVAQIIRETRVYDDTSLAELALNGSLSDVFSELDDFDAVQKALGESFTVMAAQRSDLSARQTTLEQQEQEQSDLLSAQQAQQTSLKSAEAQKQQLVAATKGQESLYQQLIANQQKTAAQIQQQLFALRDTSKSTTFGDMYSYAKAASTVTGVPAAFIMGVLSEESDLGQNVGTCTYLQAMNPTRDVPVFLALMQQLGLDPLSQKVSCAPSYGYGGAMGPAQFIPSTWKLYSDRISKASGQTPPNPWDPRTATFATAIYMGDLGADKGSVSAERQAALRYFAGSHWQNPSYAFYGNDVICLTNKMQQQIDILNGVAAAGSPVICN